MSFLISWLKALMPSKRPSPEALLARRQALIPSPELLAKRLTLFEGKSYLGFSLILMLLFFLGPSTIERMTELEGWFGGVLFMASTCFWLPLMLIVKATAGAWALVGLLVCCVVTLMAFGSYGLVVKRMLTGQYVGRHLMWCLPVLGIGGMTGVLLQGTIFGSPDVFSVLMDLWKMPFMWCAWLGWLLISVAIKRYCDLG
jgi:hypothetical protein